MHGPMNAKCDSTEHTEGIAMFPLQQWLRERATMFSNTCIASLLYFVFSFLPLYILSSLFSSGLCSSRSSSLSRVIVFLPSQCCMQGIERHSLIAPSLLPIKE